MLRLYNSLSRKKEKFLPILNKNVTIYVCGITPYDTTHIGHAFTYISFDALIRYLTYCGYKVAYTQNVTDINDRDMDILQRAKEQKIPWQKLASFWTNRFLEDMQRLNWITPAYYLKASENIPEMIKLTQKLIKNNYAYVKNGSVYFDISKKKDYGKLSRFNKKKMLKVANDCEENTLNPEKNNPLDFTLWRASAPHQQEHIPSFESPFGKGRPGWHIECSTMSMQTLGEQIDIHGGGIDLIYPHHESEIAQSEAVTSKIPFAKYWLHAGNVCYKGKKMSKSLGNIVMVSNLLKKYSPNSIRWLLLSRHYRKDWEFFEEDLIKASKQIEIIKNVLSSHSGLPRINPDKKYLYLKEFLEAMNDDLNTPKVLNFLKKEAVNISQNQLLNFLQILGFSFNEVV